MECLSHAALLGGMLLTGGLAAQQYDLRVFGVEDGLPGSTINSITQDSTGYLWLDTEWGLCRFDGRGFHAWSQNDGPPPPEIKALHRPDGKYALEGAPNGPGGRMPLEVGATCVLIPNEHSMWCGTDHGVRISRIIGVDTLVTWITELQGLGGDAVRCMFQDRSGIVWIGSYRGGLTRYTSDAVIVYDERSGLPSSKILGFSARSDGGMTIHAENGALHLPADQLRPIPVPTTRTDPEFTGHADVLIHGDGHIWYATDRGVFDHQPDGSLIRVVGSSRVDLQACKLEYSIVSPK